MKLSMEQAAYVVGKTKKTIYNHKDANKFTWDINDEGNAVIDVSELMRVYGTENGIPERLEELQSGESEAKSVNTQTYTPKPSVKKSSFIDEEYVELIKLREENKFKNEKITLLEEEKEKWEKNAQDAQNTLQKITLLLEDKTKEEGRGATWEKTMRALEQRIANQEKAAKEREEIEKKLLDENMRIKKAYSKQKKALEEEKSKGFFKKLFG